MICKGSMKGEGVRIGVSVLDPEPYLPFLRRVGIEAVML